MAWPKGRKPTKSHRQKLSKALVGIKRGPISESHREKLSAAKQGKIMNQSNSWKGDRAGYRGVHRWIVKHYGKPNICEKCGKRGTGHRMHWTCVGDWKVRSRKNWKRLCPKCHRNYDINKLNKLKV